MVCISDMWGKGRDMESDHRGRVALHWGNKHQQQEGTFPHTVNLPERRERLYLIFLLRYSSAQHTSPRARDSILRVQFIISNYLIITTLRLSDCLSVFLSLTSGLHRVTQALRPFFLNTSVINRRKMFD